MLAPSIPAEPKSEAIDPRLWASMLDDINRISKEYARNKGRTPENNPFRFPTFPKAARPPATMAMDENRPLKLAMDDAFSDWGSGAVIAGLPAEGLMFLGYTYLAELAQRPEYRVISETIADDATRKWIDFDVTGDEQEQAEQQAKDPKGFVERMADPDQKQKRLREKGKLDKVKQLKDDQLRLQVQQRFYDQARNDGFFGRSHLYLDIRTDPAWTEVPPEELKQDIGDGRSDVSKVKCPKNAFAGLRSIEPVWTYPISYNANNPLREDWYNPQVWYVMGQEIHGSRIPCFIGHPVPDILKPAYSFGGLSLSQTAKPYVDIWLQTRQSVADLIKSFSIMVLKTDMQQMMAPNAAGALMMRIAMFNMLRDNQGAFVVNNSTEDLTNVSAPLSGLHELQAQAQEHMCVQAGTLITTARGQVPIELVTLEDRVLTRQGFAPIKWVGVTDYKDTLVEINAGTSTIRVTEEHPVWSQTTSAFVSARDVSPSHSLLVLDRSANTGSPSHGGADGGGRPRPDITVTKKLAASSIGKFGKSIAGLFQRVMKSTTAMMTEVITGSEILNFSRGLNTWPEMVGCSQSLNASTIESASAAGCASQRVSPVRNSAQDRAKIGLIKSGVVGSRSRFTQCGAGHAEMNSKPSDQPWPNFAPARARSVPVSSAEKIKVDIQPVYDIEVDGLPEFFANGILIHNSSVSRIPLVKLTGISPSGLNSTSEQEIEVYDDTIAAYQKRLLDVPLRKVINFEMLSLWGEVDPEITHSWQPLRPLSEAEKGQKQKDDADRDQKYVDMGAISPGEVRSRLINDPDLPYTGLDPDQVPEPPAVEGLLGPGGGGAATEFEKDADGTAGGESDEAAP